MNKGFPGAEGRGDCALLDVDCRNPTLSTPSAKVIHSYLPNHQCRFSIFLNYYCLVCRLVGTVIKVVKYIGLLHNLLPSNFFQC